MHFVDLGESFRTHIYLQKLASIQPRTSPRKFGLPALMLLASIIHKQHPPRTISAWWPASCAIGGPRPAAEKARSPRPWAKLANLQRKITNFFNSLAGSFSAVSKRNFARKYALGSIFQDLQDVHTFAPLHTQHFSKTYFFKFSNFREISAKRRWRDFFFQV